MTTASATEVKNNFGKYMDKAQKDPVVVEKNGRGYAVILAQDEYDRLRRYEDAYWIRLAEEGKASGFLSPEETMAHIAGRMAEE